MKIQGDDVVISKEEYIDLVVAREELNRLEDAGVDNWQGASKAFNQDESIEEFREKLAFVLDIRSN